MPELFFIWTNPSKLKEKKIKFKNLKEHISKCQGTPN